MLLKRARPLACARTFSKGGCRQSTFASETAFCNVGATLATRRSIYTWCTRTTFSTNAQKGRHHHHHRLARCTRSISHGKPATIPCILYARADEAAAQSERVDSSNTLSSSERDAATLDSATSTDGSAGALHVAESALDGASALLQDISLRPDYYLSVTGVLVGAGLSAVVVSAALVAIDTLPVAPDVLRIVGMGYVFWFLSKYLFSYAKRAELKAEIDDVLAVIRAAEDRPLVTQSSAAEALAQATGELWKGQRKDAVLRADDEEDVVEKDVPDRAREEEARE